MAYRYPFDLDIPVGSTDPLLRSSSGLITATGSNSVEYRLGSTEKVNISQTRPEEAFSIRFSLDQSTTTINYPTAPHLAPRVFFHTLIATILGLFLQWANTRSAILFDVLTQITGLGCRSAAYLANIVF